MTGKTVLSPASVSLPDSQGIRQLLPESGIIPAPRGSGAATTLLVCSWSLELVGQDLRPEALCLHRADRLGRARSLVTQLLLSVHKSLTPSLPPPASATPLLIVLWLVLGRCEPSSVDPQQTLLPFFCREQI